MERRPPGVRRAARRPLGRARPAGRHGRQLHAVGGVHARPGGRRTSPRARSTKGSSTGSVTATQQHLPLIPGAWEAVTGLAPQVQAGRRLLVAPRTHRALADAGGAAAVLPGAGVVGRGGGRQAGARRVSGGLPAAGHRSRPGGRHRGFLQRVAGGGRGGAGRHRHPEPGVSARARRPVPCRHRARFGRRGIGGYHLGIQREADDGR